MRTSGGRPSSTSIRGRSIPISRVSRPARSAGSGTIVISIAPRAGSDGCSPTSALPRFAKCWRRSRSPTSNQRGRSPRRRSPAAEVVTDVASTDLALQVGVASETDRDDWEAYVAADAGRHGATGYHDWRWRWVITQAFNHEPVYLIARSGAGAVEGVLPMVF